MTTTCTHCGTEVLDTGSFSLRCDSCGGCFIPDREARPVAPIGRFEGQAIEIVIRHDDDAASLVGSEVDADGQRATLGELLWVGGCDVRRARYATTATQAKKRSERRCAECGCYGIDCGCSL